MAIPENTLSSEPVRGTFTGASALRTNDDIAYADGGVGLQDTMGGLLYQVWKAVVTQDGDAITLEADEVEAFTVLEGEDITYVDLSFDGSMRPHIAFIEGGVPKFYWFDTTQGGQVTTDYPGIEFPRVILDDKRDGQAGNRDVILAYKKDGNLYYRQQRDRFLDEYLLAENVSGKLSRIGMNSSLRLQFEFEL